MINFKCCFLEIMRSFFVMCAFTVLVWSLFIFVLGGKHVVRSVGDLENITGVWSSTVISFTDPNASRITVSRRHEWWCVYYSCYNVTNIMWYTTQFYTNSYRFFFLCDMTTVYHVSDILYNANSFAGLAKNQELATDKIGTIKIMLSSKSALQHVFISGLTVFNLQSFFIIIISIINFRKFMRR